MPPRPGPVAASTSRRTRRGAWCASCCAMTPPRETPSTSTCSWPSASSIRSTVRAIPGIRRGQVYGEDWPMPGASKLIACTPRPASSCSNGTPRSRLAPIPVIRSSGGPDPRTEVRSRRRSAPTLTSTNRMVCWSGECADTGDVPADDEGLDGLGAFVGVDGLDVGHVPHHVEVKQDAVTAEQVPCLEDDLPRLAGVVHLRDRRDRVGQPALLDEPAEPQAVQLHR